MNAPARSCTDHYMAKMELFLISQLPAARATPLREYMEAKVQVMAVGDRILELQMHICGYCIADDIYIDDGALGMSLVPRCPSCNSDIWGEYQDMPEMVREQEKAIRKMLNKRMEYQRELKHHAEFVPRETSAPEAPPPCPPPSEEDEEDEEEQAPANVIPFPSWVPPEHPPLY